MYLNRDLSVACGGAPFACPAAIFDGKGTFVQVDGGADMERYAIDDVAGLGQIYETGFVNQMFFTLADGFPVFCVDEADAFGEFVLGGYGFVAEVDTDAAGGG